MQSEYEREGTHSNPVGADYHIPLIPFTGNCRDCCMLPIAASYPSMEVYLCPLLYSSPLKLVVQVYSMA